MCSGGGGGGGSNPVTDIVETVTETISDNTPTIKVEPPAPIKVEVPTFDEVVDTVSNVTPDIKIIPEDLNEILPSAEVVSELSEDISSATPDIKMPTALDQTSFDNSIVDEVTNVISDTVDDLTPDSVEDLSDQISDNTPDVKNTITSTEDLSDAVSDSTPDIKNTTTSTGDLAEQVITVPELLDKLDETGASAAEGVKGAVNALADAGTEVATGITDSIGEIYEGSDVDTLLEDTKDVGDFMLDTVITIATGKPHGLVKDAQEDIQNTATTIQEVGDNISETTTTLGEVVTDTVNTSNQVIGEVGANAAETVVNAADDVVNEFVDAGILTRETKGGGLTEATRGGDVVRDDDLIQLGKKKSDLKAAKKKGKKGLRIDYGVNIPGVGKSGIAA